MFERWMVWTLQAEVRGGCLLASSASEFDDRPGPVREHLVATMADLFSTVRRALQIAVDQGHFRPDLDFEQFAFECTASFSAIISRRG
jgi:hypothetical protein